METVIVGQGHTGTVFKIQILYSHLMTFDNKEVIIPNGILANTDIINMSTQPTRRTEIIVGVAYGTNIEQAKEIILDILAKDSQVLQKPAPFVALNKGTAHLIWSSRCGRALRISGRCISIRWKPSIPSLRHMELKFHFLPESFIKENKERRSELIAFLY